MNTIDKTKAAAIIAKFPQRRVLVLGDIMLDKYLWGAVSRISPEAPVPVVDVHRDTSCLGGAGNVSRNLQQLGAEALLAGVVGEDAPGDWIRAAITETRGVLAVPGRPTTVKTRIIAHQQQVVRVDQEERAPIPRTVRDRILEFVRRENPDGLFISDYQKGMVGRSLMQRLLADCQAAEIPVFVDPKVANIQLFPGVTLLTPNHLEAERIVHLPCRTDAEVEAAGRRILDRFSPRHLIIKRGEQGMTVFGREQETLHIPTIAKEVFDVTGAGDTVIAVAGLALLCGATPRESALLANTAAGLVVGKLGTAALTAEELLTALS